MVVHVLWPGTLADIMDFGKKAEYRIALCLSFQVYTTDQKHNIILVRGPNMVNNFAGLFNVAEYYDGFTHPAVTNINSQAKVHECMFACLYVHLYLCMLARYRIHELFKWWHCEFRVYVQYCIIAWHDCLITSRNLLLLALQNNAHTVHDNNVGIPW